MDRGTPRGVAGAAFRKLTKQDIDRRIERVIEDLASAGEAVGSDADANGLRPLRIAPRELFERVRPFLSRN